VTEEGLDFELIRKPLGREGIRRVTASVLESPSKTLRACE